MSASSSADFGHKLQYAKSSYDRNGDVDAYLSSALKAALQLLAEEHGQNAVSRALSVSSPAFEAIIDYGRDGFSCPINSGHSIYDFLSGLNYHIKDRLRRDYYAPAAKHLPQAASAALESLIAFA